MGKSSVSLDDFSESGCSKIMTFYSRKYRSREAEALWAAKVKRTKTCVRVQVVSPILLTGLRCLLVTTVPMVLIHIADRPGDGKRFMLIKNSHY